MQNTHYHAISPSKSPQSFKFVYSVTMIKSHITFHNRFILGLVYRDTELKHFKVKWVVMKAFLCALSPNYCENVYSVTVYSVTFSVYSVTFLYKWQISHNWRRCWHQWDLSRLKYISTITSGVFQGSSKTYHHKDLSTHKVYKQLQGGLCK